jgi:hypothetical protein
VHTKIINLTSLPAETSELQCTLLENIHNDEVNKAKKMYGINFRLSWENNWGVCDVHIKFSCLQSAVDCLPFGGDRFSA